MSSYCVCRLSAGACVDVTVAVARGEAASGVAIVRPPGHHAESNTAMGFCFFNNAGIAARAAQVSVLPCITCAGGNSPCCHKTGRVRTFVVATLSLGRRHKRSERRG